MLIAAGLSVVMLTSAAGCGKRERMEAEINPDTPVSEVSFPLKEQAELSFITNAPATSTQDPNERVIFQRMEEQTNVHMTGPALLQISLQTRRTWLWHSLETFRMVCSMQE